MPDPKDTSQFDLQQFLPYLLNQAAEAASRGFHAVYREDYGMTRTQWRVLANLGKFGAMTARDICAISHIEKTKVSRAVQALQAAEILRRDPSQTDRRVEILSLTPIGAKVFAQLGLRAIAFDQDLRERLGAQDAANLTRILTLLAATNPFGDGSEIPDGD